MASVQAGSRAVDRQIRALFAFGAAGDLTDQELLSRFATKGDESAFEALVSRHGPMVFRVCREILADSHDAQDAFQATFLVLLRRSASIRKRGSVGLWLHGVARRVSAKALAETLRARLRASRPGIGPARCRLGPRRRSRRPPAATRAA